MPKKIQPLRAPMTLKRLMAERGLKIVQVAQHLGYAPSTLYKISNGDPAKQYQFDAIRDALGISAEALLEVIAIEETQESRR